MNSYNNKPHYTIFCVLLLLNPSIGQKILTVPQIRYSFNVTGHILHQYKKKGMSDLLMDETFHCKRYFTCSESQNKGFFP